MKLLRNLFFTIVLVLFSPFTWSLTGLDDVNAFHDYEIKKILKDYTLEKSLNITYEITLKEGVNTEDFTKKIYDLPGIFQEVSDKEKSSRGKIIKILASFERDIIIIEKRKISDSERTLVEAALVKSLYLPEGYQFRYVDESGIIGDKARNIVADFLSGAYSTLIAEGQLLWLFFLGIGVICAIFISSKIVRTSKNDGYMSSSGSSGHFSSSGPSGGASLALGGSDKLDDLDLNSRSVSSSSKQWGNNDAVGASRDDVGFDVFSFNVFAENILRAYEKYPGVSRKILWSYFPKGKAQLYAVEVISGQEKHIKNCEKLLSCLNECFDLQGRQVDCRENTVLASMKHFAELSFEMLHLVNTPPRLIQHDALFQKIFPQYGDHFLEMMELGAEEHVDAFMTLFPEKFLKFLETSKQMSSGMLAKLGSYAFADEERYKLDKSVLTQFEHFLNNLDFSKNTDKDKSLDSRVLNIALNSTEKNLKGFMETVKDSYGEVVEKIPMWSWIKTTSKNTLRQFFIELTDEECTFLNKDCVNFKDLISHLDDRGRFRVSEKLSHNSSIENINIRGIRLKVAKYFPYKRDKPVLMKEDSKSPGVKVTEKKKAG